MTDLLPEERQQVMNVVFSVERVLRAVLQPTKINLASFGNLVPHLHWHVIPRYADDAHFPSPVWGQQQRDPSTASLQVRSERLPALRAKMRQRLATYL